MKTTYKDLFEIFEKLTPEQLKMDAVVYSGSEDDFFLVLGTSSTTKNNEDSEKNKQFYIYI